VAGGAVRTVVAKVALAALDLTGVPKLIEVAVVGVGVGGARDHVGGGGVGDAAATTGASAGVGIQLGRAGEVLVLVAGAVTTVDEVASELLDVLTGTVAGAALRAGRTTAALALVAIEALALTRLAVADALVAALSVVVGLVGAIGGISPGEGEGAGTLGAVGTLPVLVAGALVLGTADAIPGMC